MSKSDARNAILFGSYLTANLPVVPELRALEINEGDLSSAAEELLSQGFIMPLPGQGTLPTDPFRCSYRITPKGLEGLDLRADLSLFKLIIATGGSVVHYHEEKNQISNTNTFEQNMIKQIGAAKVSDQEKQAAKSKLKEFLAHPLLGTVLEAVLKAALKP